MVKKTVAAFALLTTSAFALGAPQPPLRGYTAEHAVVENQWEKTLRALPEAARIRENVRRLSARPHHIGSAYDKDNAEWIAAQWRSFGLDAKVETFTTLFPTPKLRKLELFGSAPYTAKLEEKALKVDPTTGQKTEQLPTYVAYSRDGDVTGPVVYVNYGTPADYEELESRGISVKGAIVIARYGQTFRAVKPRVAAEHGAVGILIYSDPKDDGFARGDVYPKGPMRPADGVQRGSVLDLSIQPGDPQTPGVGAVAGVKLLPLNESKTLTAIPTLPISYEDAQPFLESVQGEVAPESWRGALAIPYKIGVSQAKAHLALAFNWDRKPLYDIIARIPGSQFPDQWVIRGNHHDAWVNGASDPVSGAASEIEEGRALAELLKQGWRPKRTILYAIWDGEEGGLLGSTEWGEAHAEELKQHAVAYLNSDSNGRGYLRAEGSSVLENFFNEVAKDVVDPETQLSVWKRARLVGIAHAATPEQRAELRSRADQRISALGSGSDYTVFLDHLGIPSVNIGYGGEDEGGGQYHSIYDDFYWYTHFQDTDFAYGRALAQTAATWAIRLADADVIPFKYSNFADAVHGYVSELKKAADSERSRINERNTEIAEGVYVALKDPKKIRVAPEAKELPPYFNFAPLDQASDDLVATSAAFEKAYDGYVVGGGVEANAQLLHIERSLLSDEGLPGRAWYKNLVYAPGYETGYSAKTLPLVREALEQKRWKDVDPAIARTAEAIERETAALKTLTETLNGKR